MISRRNLLAVSGLGVAATVSAAKGVSFGNPDEPAQGAINGKSPGNLTDPGPRNEVIGSQFPSAQSPPATDVGGMPTTWASFNNAAKRIQNGGWARQVTVEDFAISKEISGVNMRLTAGGIRELHWHQAAEWAIMTYGNCRVTVLDAEGRPYVGDVKAGDLWYFPPGAPHSLQGLGPDGCEFVICFDDGHADEFNTLLVTDWLAHTPPSVLAKNFGVPAEHLCEHPAAQSLDLPGRGSRRSGGGSRGDSKERASANASIYFPASILPRLQVLRRPEPSRLPTARISRSQRRWPRHW